MANIKDKKVQELLKLAEERKQQLTNIEDPKWLTKGDFKFGKGQDIAFNVRTITDENVFINALAFLIDREKSFNSAAEELEIEGEFNWYGHSVEVWKTDFKTRISQLKAVKERKELAEFEKELDGMISDELRDEMKLDKLTKALSTNK